MLPSSIPASLRRVWQWWTGGKESAWALNTLKSGDSCEVGGLVIQLDRTSQRSVIHGIRRELLERQAAVMDLPFACVEFDHRGPHRDYEAALERAFHSIRRGGAEFVAFGDLQSEAARVRRSMQLARTGLAAKFPMWGSDTWKLAEEMLEGGLSAWICAVDSIRLSSKFVGRRFDADFLSDLPPHVDPCGENGEFHTFVEWAPGWRERVAVEPTRVIEQYGFSFVELSAVPAGGSAFVEEASADRSFPGFGAPNEKVDPFQYYERLKRVLVYVDEHLGEELTVAGTAAVASMQPASFGRYFRRRVGIGFREWLGRRRVERARELLRAGDHPLSQIGRKVGFGSNRTFRHLFRRYYGCSPSEYRKNCLHEG